MVVGVVVYMVMGMYIVLAKIMVLLLNLALVANVMTCLMRL